MSDDQRRSARCASPNARYEAERNAARFVEQSCSNNDSALGQPQQPAHNVLSAEASASGEDALARMQLQLSTLTETLTTGLSRLTSVISVNTRRTPCEHNFCRECILGWLQHHSNCPACQEYLRASDLRVVWHQTGGNRSAAPSAPAEGGPPAHARSAAGSNPSSSGRSSTSSEHSMTPRAPPRSAPPPVFVSLDAPRSQLHDIPTPTQAQLDDERAERLEADRVRAQDRHSPSPQGVPASLASSPRPPGSRGMVFSRLSRSSGPAARRAYEERLARHLALESAHNTPGTSKHASVRGRQPSIPATDHTGPETAPQRVQTSHTSANTPSQQADVAFSALFPMAGLSVETKHAITEANRMTRQLQGYIRGNTQMAGQAYYYWSKILQSIVAIQGDHVEEREGKQWYIQNCARLIECLHMKYFGGDM
ncbi:hypothetical protein LTR37_020093 [Vermiconidia calcicola]|uniref:Uncharacterized protein n=1 Tax=Vermiconidia calcicola TaxID=1690605 RepID=A0ACC3MC88_9PEZI|nr:hypothetical protein LTR37_020093 [Vermiconidia calcicola]